MENLYKRKRGHTFRKIQHPTEVLKHIFAISITTETQNKVSKKKMVT
jgi:hypothetical protein